MKAAICLLLFVALCACAQAGLLGATLIGPANPGALLQGPASEALVSGPDGSAIAAAAQAGAVGASPIAGGAVSAAVAPGVVIGGHGLWGR